MAVLKKIGEKFKWVKTALEAWKFDPANSKNASKKSNSKAGLIFYSSF